MRKEPSSILKVPRRSRDLRLHVMQPEIVAFYNAFCDLLRTSRWPDYQPPLLKHSYPGWAMLWERCRAEGVNGVHYLAWILEQGVIFHPRAIVAFAMANGTFFRFRKVSASVQQQAPRFGGYGARLVDDRTGQPVTWIFDQQGQPLIAPPSEGDVFDEHGRPIPLRRSL